MPDTGSPSRSPAAVDVAWAVLAVCCLAAMVAWPMWEQIPLYLIWISLTLVYGFRYWSANATAAVVSTIVLCSGAVVVADNFQGVQLWRRLTGVVMMAALFMTMLWHARRRAHAQKTIEALAEERAVLLEQEERLLHNVSHELRTPVTIARGHLELLARRLSGDQSELAVALEELRRVDEILERLLLLARADRPEQLSAREIRLVPFLEDTFMRWAEVAPRAWRLGSIVDVTVSADEVWLRTALDALLENAVQYSDESSRIELSARGERHEVVISVEDEGHGIDPETAPYIFERFARSDEARARREGGVGLGLAIVAAIARVHGGSCTVIPSDNVGSVFEFRLPLPQAEHADLESAADEEFPALPVLQAGSASIGG
jgi:signal transduction histidine kinase